MAEPYDSLDVGRFLLELRSERDVIQHAIEFLEGCRPLNSSATHTETHLVADIGAISIQSLKKR